MPTEELFITILPDGTIEAIYSDELADLFAQGTTTVTRASHVEPAPGGWTADMTPRFGPDAPVLGPFPSRGEALAAEVAYLQAAMSR